MLVEYFEQRHWRDSLDAAVARGNALRDTTWSNHVLKDLADKMGTMVITCLVRGQGTRVHSDAKLNYQEAFRSIEEHAKNSLEPLRLADILEWHRLCFKDQHA